MRQAYPGVSGQDIRFGLLDLSDLQAIFAIELSGHAYPWSADVFRDCFKVGYERWGLWLAGELVGFVILCWQYDELHLLNLCIRRSFHRSGLGRRLLRFAIASSRATSARGILLEVRMSNQAAIELYRSENFEEIGRRKGYYPAGACREDALVMELPLASE